MKCALFFLALFSFAESLFGFDGFYFGAAGGVSATQGGQDGIVDSFVLTPTGHTIFSSPDISTDILQGNGLGMFYGGFGWRYQIFYGGVEAFAQFANNNLGVMRQNFNSLVDEDPGVFNSSDQTQVTIGPWSCGLDFRPGILLSPATLLYGRLGFNYAERKLNSDLENFGARPGEVWDLPLLVQDSKKGCFLRLGGGVEQYLGEHLALRVDYIFTDYRTLAIDGSNSSTAVLPLVSSMESKEIHLKNHALLIGLSYYFCKDPSMTRYGYYGCRGNHFCGFYLAGAAGAALTDCNPQGNILNMGESSTLFHDLLPIQIASQLTDTDFRGNLYAGYGYQNRLLYAGLEAFAQYSPYSRSKSDEHDFTTVGIFGTTALNTVITTARIDPWQFGIQGRLGLLPTPVMLVYGTIGAAGARIGGSSDAYTNYPGFTPINVSLSKRTTRASLRAGGGIEYVLDSRWHLRADYIYSDYGSIKLNGSSSIDDPSIGAAILTDDTKISLINHAITLGLSLYL